MKFKKNTNQVKAYSYKLLLNNEQQEFFHRLFVVRYKAWNLLLSEYNKFPEKGMTTSEKAKLLRKHYKEYLSLEENQWQILKNKRYYDYLSKSFFESWSKFFKSIKDGSLKIAKAKYIDNYNKKKKARTGIKWNQKRFDDLFKPKFKSVHDAMSFSTDIPKGGAWIDLKKGLVSPGNGSKPIKMIIKKTDKIFKDEIISFKKLTFKRDKTGCHFVTIFFEYKNVEPSPRKKSAVTMDWGISDFEVLSNGIAINLPDTSKIDEKIDLLKKKLSHKMKHNNYYKTFYRADLNKIAKSKNFNRLKLKISKLYKKKSNKLNHHLHIITKCITDCYTLIGVENLNVSGQQGMVKKAASKLNEDGKTFDRNNKKKVSKRNREILNRRPYETKRQLKYKSEWKGGLFNAYDPADTTQTCSTCGKKRKEKVEQYEMEWDCKCGAHNIRKFNAAQVGLQRTLEHFDMTLSDLNKSNQKKAKKRLMDMLQLHNIDFHNVKI